MHSLYWELCRRVSVPPPRIPGQMQAPRRKVSRVCCLSPPGPRAHCKGLHMAGAEEKSADEESRTWDQGHRTDEETVACVVSDLPKVTHVVKGRNGIPTQDRNTPTQDLSP